MEAATPLRHTRVTVLANRVLVDGLSVDDPTAVELLRAREEAGDDPARVVGDAIEIGARVLHREQTGANVEFVKAEFEKTARELDTEFVERSRKVAERLDQKFDEAFAPDHGHVSKALERHFGDGSSVAVQNRVKAMLAEAAVQIRDDLRKQFTADSDDNPLAIYQRASLAVVKQSSDQHNTRLQEMNETIQGLRLELERVRAEQGEGRGRRAGGRSRHRQGPLVRGGRLRRASTRSRSARATTATPSATSRARPARPATSSWPSRAAPARRAGASCSRPRPPGSPSPRRSRSSTAPAPSATPTTPCSSCPTRSGSRRACTSCASTAATSSSSASTPRTAPRSRSRSPTSWPAHAC